MLYSINLLSRNFLGLPLYLLSLKIKTHIFLFFLYLFLLYIITSVAQLLLYCTLHFYGSSKMCYTTTFDREWCYFASRYPLKVFHPFICSNNKVFKHVKISINLLAACQRLVAKAMVIDFPI